ncbi:MAG: hypothetical protein QXG39_01375 [Candidatus Aenigmatarchaeota archaeon]
MPTRNIHKKISKIVTGNYCEKTNIVIDYPVKLFGKKHRKFFHDPISVVMIGLMCDGIDGTISGILHVVTDNYCSKYPLLKKFLKYLF